ncbi:hypothetical protein CYB_2010 [Synechococcus sp. JA-2-3B'a(2-13)]|nr:hypothetical protein CYB_2010 [Synechococcus sp. JA-2-3B'a(2-13)]
MRAANGILHVPETLPKLLEKREVHLRGDRLGLALGFLEQQRWLS